MAGSKTSVLFLGKAGDSRCETAAEFCKKNFDAQVFFGQWNESRPAAFDTWNGDYIISYLSRWILPEQVIKKAKKAAINFHPGSPDYPGFGCYNFALYENAKEYGTTCHHMEAKVDSGGIIAARRFPIIESDTVASLLDKTYTHQLSLFYEVMAYLTAGTELPVSSEKWSRKPGSRKELDRLSEINVEMDKEEVHRRIRATSFGTWKPLLRFQDFIFELKAPDPK